jgi:hypothetical protein
MRILFEQLHQHLWAHGFSIIAFTFSFSVFIGCIWYALRMPARNLDRMAHLPLEDSGKDDSPKSSTQEDHSHATDPH